MPSPTTTKPVRASRPHAILVALIAPLLATSCAHRSSKPPMTVQNGSSVTHYNETQFQRDRGAYSTQMDAANYAAATVLRDRIIFSIKVDIDAWYAAEEAKLHEQRAGFNTFGDFAELALAGAGAITHGEEAKTVLATILSVGKGTRLSFDKNWFREKGTESLINAMRSGRNAKLAEIINKMTANQANKYTFEEAWSDLIAYYQAGTLHGGLVTLSTNTGEEAAKTQEDVKKANKPRYLALATATEEMVNATAAAGDKAMALPPAQMRALLQSLGVAIPAGATDAQVKQLVNQTVQRLILATPAERKRILDAIAQF